MLGPAAVPAPLPAFSFPNRRRRDNEPMAQPSDNSAPASASEPPSFRERLVPGFGLYLALLLLIPAVMLTLTPLSSSWALPVAIALYVLIAVSFVAFAPRVEVADGVLAAGSARIPVALLGDCETLDRESLRRAIGPGLDARSFLLVRGYIHSGVRIAVTDPADPAPYWIITTRRPEELRRAMLAAQRRSVD